MRPPTWLEQNDRAAPAGCEIQRAFGEPPGSPASLMDASWRRVAAACGIGQVRIGVGGSAHASPRRWSGGVPSLDRLSRTDGRICRSRRRDVIGVIGAHRSWLPAGGSCRCPAVRTTPAGFAPGTRLDLRLQAILRPLPSRSNLLAQLAPMARARPHPVGRPGVQLWAVCSVPTR